jgi:hypothetical protein
MYNTFEGIFRNGKIELLECPADMKEARVIVTFLPLKKSIDLRDRGIDEEQAADLRWRLQAFSDDWSRPEMDIYDDL